MSKNKVLIHSIIIVFISTIIIIAGIFLYPLFVLFFKGLISLFESIVYYFSTIFKISELEIPNITYNFITSQGSNFPGIIPPSDIPLPTTTNIFLENFYTSFWMIWKMEYFKDSFSFIWFFFSNFGAFLFVLITFILSVRFFNKFYFKQHDLNKVGYSKGFIRIDNLINYMKNGLYNLKKIINFVLSNRFYKVLIILSILFFTGVLHAILETFICLLIVLSSFNFSYLYYWIYDCLYFLFPFISIIPLPIFLIIIYVLFDRHRKKKAIQKLIRLNDSNKCVVDSLGVSTLITGTPGCGKSTLLTDIALTQEELFRYRLLSIMNKYKSYFPDYDFFSYEIFIKEKKENREFKNRIQVEDYISFNEDRFYDLLISNEIELDSIDILFNYDFFNKPTSYYDELKVISIFEAIKIYGQCYFIYIRESSSIVGTQGIRSDFVYGGKPTFPLFDYNYFARNIYSTFEEKTYRNYSHILNMDSLKMGKRINDFPPILDCVVVAVPEWDKERGNQFDQKKARDNFLLSDLSNINNDEVNLYFKISRHFNTIDNYPFFKFIGDLQRLNSLNLDFVEISENIISIESKSSNKNALLLWTVSRIFSNYIVSKCDEFIFKYNQTRNTLSSLYKVFSSIKKPFFNYLTKRTNLYSYKTLKLKITHGSQQDGNEEKYYLCFKKIYSERFATDFYKNIVTQEFKTATTTFEDEPKFKGLYGDIDELKQSNSYTVSKLLRTSPIKEKEHDDAINSLNKEE